MLNCSTDQFTITDAAIIYILWAGLKWDSYLHKYTKSPFNWGESDGQSMYIMYTLPDVCTYVALVFIMVEAWNGFLMFGYNINAMDWLYICTIAIIIVYTIYYIPAYNAILLSNLHVQHITNSQKVKYYY